MNAYGQVKPSRALDAHVQVVIFQKEVVWAPEGQAIVPYCKGERDYGFGVQVPTYSEDMREVWKVVDCMKALPRQDRDRFVNFLMEEARTPDEIKFGNSLEAPTVFDLIMNLTPVKICRAALETIRTLRLEAAGVKE